jgi:hypothetical protein
MANIPHAWLQDAKLRECGDNSRDMRRVRCRSAMEAREAAGGRRGKSATRYFFVNFLK